MPSYAPQARPQPQASRLRELFTRVLGWQRLAGERSRVEADGRAHSLLPLATCHGTVALLCEPPLGGPLPDYRTRRHLRSRIDRMYPRHLTIFTDTAHAEQLWTWVGREPGGPLAYHERSYRPGWPEDASPGTLQAIALDLCEESGGLRGTPGREHPGPDLLAALLRRVRQAYPGAFHLGGPLAQLPPERPRGRGPCPEGDPAAPGWELQQIVQDAIEGAEQPELLRAFWRGLLGLSVLDRACGTGGWLLCALETLAPVYAACLERMQSWMDELERSHPRPRPERLADFRAVLARSDDPRLHPCRTHFIHETILLYNLYGADRDADAVEICRLRLLMRLHATGAQPVGGSAPGLECGLRVGDPARGFASLQEVERALLAGPDPAARLQRIAEQAEITDRALGLLRGLRLRQGIPLEELHVGCAGLQQRRDAVRAELDLLLARREGIDPDRPGEFRAWREEHRPLHPFLEYYGIMRRGGFSVCRGEGR